MLAVTSLCPFARAVAAIKTSSRPIFLPVRCKPAVINPDIKDSFSPKGKTVIREIISFIIFDQKVSKSLLRVLPKRNSTTHILEVKRAWDGSDRNLARKLGFGFFSSNH